MVYVYVLLYLVVGYFVVRFVHANLDRLPNVGVGVLAVFIWPILFIASLFFLKEDKFTDKLFGKSRKV